MNPQVHKQTAIFPPIYRKEKMFFPNALLQKNLQAYKQSDSPQKKQAIEAGLHTYRGYRLSSGSFTNVSDEILPAKK